MLNALIQILFSIYKLSRPDATTVPAAGESGRYSWDALIIAMGASAQYLGLDSEHLWEKASAPAQPVMALPQQTGSNGGGNPLLKRRSICRTSVLM